MGIVSRTSQATLRRVVQALALLASLLAAACSNPAMRLVQASADQPPATTLRASERADAYRAIDDHIERQMRELRIPGLALAIVEDNQIVHLKGFGVAGPDLQPVTPQTPFQLASIAKPMTGVAVMQLAEAGMLDLDAPVQRSIPWFRVADEVASAQITPRHLLYHTSGLPDVIGLDYALSGDARPDALEARVRELRTVRLSRPVGEAYEYSNAGYTVLGLLIQTVSGQPYAEYMREHVFAPLQMRHTFIDWAEARRDGAATGHRFWFGAPLPGQLAIDRATLPAGASVGGSAEDVAHFVIAQLNGGRFGDAAILSPEGIAEMLRPVTPAAAGGEAHAMDWGVGAVAGEAAISKGGSVADFKSQIVIFPERRLGMVVLMNANRQFDAALGDLRLPMLPYNVAEILVGQPPTSFAASPVPTLCYALLLTVVLLQAAGMARTAMLLRRWRDRPVRRPRGWLSIAQRLGLPLLANLLWGLFALVGFPASFRAPFSYGLYIAPDLFSVLLVSGTVALVWAVVRTGLAWMLVRSTDSAPGAAATLAQQETRGALR